MENSLKTWLSVLTALSLVGMIVNPIITILLTNYLFRRGKTIKLRLTFDNNQDCLPLVTGWYRNSESEERSTQRKFVRLRLYNDSPDYLVANQSAVQLLGIWETSKRQYSQLSYPNPQYLRWNEDEDKRYEKKNIPHGGPQYVDLLCRDERPTVGIRLMDAADKGVELKGGRTYLFKVQATAEGAKAVSKNVRVKLGEKFDDVKFVWGESGTGPLLAIWASRKVA